MTVSGLWEIVIPESTKNYIVNPSYEVSGAGSWSAYTLNSGAGSIAQSAAWQSRGVYSMLVTKNTDGTATARYGVQIAATDVSEFVSGSYATASFDINGAGVGANNSVGVILRISTASPTYTSTLAIAQGTTGRYSLTVGPTAATATAIDLFIYILGDDAGTLYIDGVQVELKDHDTTYCDGTQRGCSWAGRAHYSTSTRNAQERSGGRVYNLTDDYGLHVTGLQELGYAPINHISQQSALLPGATYLGERINPRVLTLTGLVDGSSRADLHGQRKDIIDALKSDLVNKNQPVTLRYTGANSSTPAELSAYYDSGLGFGTPNGNNEENIPLRLIAYDPFFYQDGNRAAALDVKDSLANANSFLYYSGTSWSTANGGLTPVPVSSGHKVLKGPDGKVYIGGNFTTAGSVAAANIASFTMSTETWAALGTGLAGTNHSCYSMLFAPNGDLYAGGDFTTAGGVAVNRIAKWDTLAASPAWTALTYSGNSGVTGGGVPTVFALALSSGGLLYVGGTFTTAGGVAASNIATWNEATDTWAAIGSLNSNVSALVIGPDGTVYAGGNFTNLNSTTYDGIAYLDGSTWKPLSTGIAHDTSAYVTALAIDSNGELILGGQFSTAGGRACANIARWNGTQMSPLGDGLDGVVTSIRVVNDGIYAMGHFNSISAPESGTGPDERVAFWNGSFWTHFGAAIPLNTATTFADLLIDDSKAILIYPNTGTATLWGTTSVTNSGSRTAYPVIKIKRSGGTLALLELIRNRTTGGTLYFSYYLQDGEELTIDLSPGNKSCTSSFSGNQWGAILRNSDVGAFYLQPGVNQIEAYVWDSGTPTITATMEWKVTHWSADGVAA